jgi:uncharacterized protein
MLASEHPTVVALAGLIQSGDVEGLAALVAKHPSLATDRFGDTQISRTALLIATDWPGHFPRVAETIAVLVGAGAPVNGRFAGPHRETPLHWAASSDDVEAISALLDLGADIEADGAIHTDGAPLSDAVVFAQWNAARLLVAQGATMTIWQAAALGEMSVLNRLISESFEGDLTNACWHACRAGQLEATQALVANGADIDWLGYDGLTSRRAGVDSGNETLATWLQEDRNAETSGHLHSEKPD